MRLVMISDTHGRHAELDLPAGDILIHAGDFSKRGTEDQLIEFNEWLGELDFAHKVVIAGNHDFLCEDEPEFARSLLTNCHYLLDQAIEIEGIKFYGSPWTPFFFNWAFNLHRGEPLVQVFEKIPDDVDILITHGPVMGILDTTSNGQNVGCAALGERIRLIRPKLHVCGHIHESNGTHTEGGTLFVNASSLDLRYRPTQPIYVVEYTNKGVSLA